MLDVKFGGISCKISLLFPAVLLCLLLADKTGLASIGFLAAILHEGGHCVALCCYGEKPKSITVSFYGMRMVLAPDTHLSYQKQIFVSLAGPLANILCALTIVVSGGENAVSMLHWILAIMNLLPVLPLDGGQVIYSVLCMVFNGPKALLFTKAIGYLTVVPLVLLGMLLYLHTGYNFTLLAMSLYVGISMLFYKGN